jgi:hypothetical protein
MARARRKKPEVQVNAGEGKPIMRDVPAVCPVCGQPFVKGTLDRRAEMPTHLQGHAPVEPCGSCGDKHQGWKIDFDTISYPRPGLYFYCDPCGRYGMEHFREEVIPSGEA